LAVGDTINGITSVAAGAYLDLQPTGTVAWVIHNIYHGSDIQLEYYDGTNSCIFDTDAGSGVYGKFAFHCTNGIRIRVKNTTGGAILIGYDGIVTHT
jgi:hypothetical protein